MQTYDINSCTRSLKTSFFFTKEKKYSIIQQWKKGMNMNKNLIKETKLEYRDKINIPNIPFGIEIEFAQANFNTVRKNLEKTLNYNPVKIKWDEKKYEITDQYKLWRLKNEITVQTYSSDESHEKFGGEVISPIMKNQKKYWKELKQICETLKKTENIELNGNCSIHIHTDKKIYNQIQEYKNLLKLIMLYQDIVIKFFLGETDRIREMMPRCAKPMSTYIYTNLDKLEQIETEEELNKFLHYDRKWLFNFMNLGPKKKQTLENRGGNPTLNENTIQNYVLFNHNFLNYAKKENFDDEFIEYKIKKYQTLSLADALKTKTRKAQELTNLIIKDELDKLYILKQYLKLYNENDIEKKYHL